MRQLAALHFVILLAMVQSLSSDRMCLYAARRGLFTLPLGVLGRLCSMIVALPEYLLHCFTYLACLTKC